MGFVKTPVLTLTDNVPHVTDTITFKGAVGSFSAQSDAMEVGELLSPIRRRPNVFEGLRGHGCVARKYRGHRTAIETRLSQSTNLRPVSKH